MSKLKKKCSELVVKIRKLKGGVLNYYTHPDGGKRYPKPKECGITALAMVLMGTGGILLTGGEDTSFVENSPQKIIQSESVQAGESPKTSYDIGGIKEVSGSENHKKPRVQRSQPNLISNIKYKAKQVLRPDNHQNVMDALPTGSNLIGRLLTAIDTRDSSQIVKVILPYGGVFKNERVLEKNTVLMGKVNYPGKGEKVFIQFDRGIHPDGREFKVEAQALNSSDYSSGLLGEYHSQADLRFLATVGLKMLSSGSEVLVEKEALSEAQAPTPKATMKNAMLQGLSEGANMEAGRQAQEMQAKKEYVTVDAGEDVIVNLLNRLSKSEIR